VALDRSPQTENALLSVLLRSPAVIGTLSLSPDSTPQVAVSPDGRTLVVSDSTAGQVALYDARSLAPRGQVLNDFRGDQPPTYSGDGSLLVYPGGPYLVVRDARTLGVRNRLPIPAPFSQQLAADVPDGSIVITPDRRLVYYGYWLVDSAGRPTDAYLSRWSLPSGRPLSTIRLGSGPLLAVRPIDHGAALMVVTAHDIATYDAGTGRRVRSEAIRPVPLLPTAAAISPDGATVAIGSETGSVSFVNTATGAERRGRGDQTTPVASTVYAPDGKVVTTVDDGGNVIVWNPASGTETAALPGPAARVRDSTISPSGSTLYTAGVGGVVLAWDLTGRRTFGRTARLGRGGPCCGSLTPPAPPLALSPDGSRFAVVLGSSIVGVFSTDTFQREASFAIDPTGAPITALAWSPTGAALAVGGRGGVVQLWSVSGKPRFERSLFGLAPHPRQPEAIEGLAFSPDGAVVAAVDKSLPPRLGHLPASPFATATMAMWRVGTGRLLRPPVDLGDGSLNGWDAVAFSHNGKLLATTLLAGGVRILDPSTGRALRTLADPGDNAISLAFSPAGTLAAGTLGGNVHLWNPATGKQLAPAQVADAAAPIASLAFDPTGQWFTTAGYQDGSIKVWSAASIQQVGPRLSSDPGATSTVMFASAGNGLLLAVDDRGGVFTWPISIGVWEKRACSFAGPGLTRARWAQLVGGRGYPTVCSDPDNPAPATQRERVGGATDSEALRARLAR
jgi:WD40 repeat protein